MHKIVKSIELLSKYDIILIEKYSMEIIYCCKIIRAEFVSMFETIYSKGLRLLVLTENDDIFDNIQYYYI
ncbi:hypothetical protein AN1V17_17160 [Vallitalea sediminicola]